MLKRIIKELSPYPLQFCERRKDTLVSQIGYQTADGKIAAISFAISRLELRRARTTKVKQAIMRYHVKRAVEELRDFLEKHAQTLGAMAPA